jgi:hypothetical protein
MRPYGSFHFMTAAHGNPEINNNNKANATCQCNGTVTEKAFHESCTAILREMCNGAVREQRCDKSLSILFASPPGFSRDLIQTPTN